MQHSTIAAIATAPGAGGIAIVRLSGPESYEVAAKVFRPANPAKKVANAKGYTAMFGAFVEGEEAFDEGVALFFRAPHSYTGEDVVELSCHGGSAVARRLVEACIAAGASPAAPGEYTPEEQLWLAAAAEAGQKAKGSKPQKAAKPADARSARRENSRACREAVQGRSSRSRDAGAGDASPAQSLAAWREFAEEYFPELAKRPAVVHGGGVLLPAAFPQTNLHVLRAGVFVGSVQKGRFVPEHHLFTAFGALCQNREELTLADSRTVEYLSGREIEAHTAADGWCCVTVDGWPLGGGKVSGGRVKNHYPKALRLL